jgi:hypothetical protein
VERERSKSPIQLPNKNSRTHMNQKSVDFYASASSLSAHAESTVSPSGNIKNGDIIQVRLLIRSNATVSL